MQSVDDLARRILEEMHQLPDTIHLGAAELYRRFDKQGLQVVIEDGGTYRRATNTELCI
jgi:hypothetical protein